MAEEKEQNAAADPPEQETAGQGAVEAARVSPLDPDFLIILPLAVVTDILGFIPIVGSLVNLVVAPVITLWLYWHTKRLADARTHAEQTRKQYTERMTARRAKASRSMRTTRNPLRRFWLRAVMRVIIEFIPFINMLPLWTMSVIGALRAK